MSMCQCAEAVLLRGPENPWLALRILRPDSYMTGRLGNSQFNPIIFLKCQTCPKSASNSDRDGTKSDYGFDGNWPKSDLAAEHGKWPRSIFLVRAGLPIQLSDYLLLLSTLEPIKIWALATA